MTTRESTLVLVVLSKFRLYHVFQNVVSPQSSGLNVLVICSTKFPNYNFIWVGPGETHFWHNSIPGTTHALPLRSFSHVVGPWQTLHHLSVALTLMNCALLWLKSPDAQEKPAKTVHCFSIAALSCGEQQECQPSSHQCGDATASVFTVKRSADVG